jgi:hypothetical protein
MRSLSQSIKAAWTLVLVAFVDTDRCDTGNTTHRRADRITSADRGVLRLSLDTDRAIPKGSGR